MNLFTTTASVVFQYSAACCDNCSIEQWMNHANALIRRINSSTKATEHLIVFPVKKLTEDCPAQWSSMILMINHMLEVKKLFKLYWRSRDGMVLLLVNGECYYRA